MKKSLPFKKKLISTSIFFSLMFLVAGPAFAITATDNVIVTLDVDEGITISNGPNATLAPNIGITNNSAIGSSAWTVTTNAVNGYSLAVKASTSPALQSGSNSFADYTETTAGTPETWSVASGAKEFGYSVYGTDVPSSTWGTGSSCGTGSTPSATLKYVGLKTTDKVVATKNTVTPVSGTTTNICFAAAQNGVYASSGTYTATITATATTL